MADEKFDIDQSKLEEAHSTLDRKWLEKTFKKARKIIKGGGRVNVIQRFSNASMETVALIDNLEGLEHYVKKYSV